jgi:predicted RecB family nuclease
MMVRYDVSRVPLQGAYVARQCPVRAQNDVIVPGERVEPGPFQLRLFGHGNAFETSVVAELLAAPRSAVAIEGTGAVAELATVEAMRRGVPLILNGRLVDEHGHRVGKPDILVRTAEDRYRAVDVKWHSALEVRSPSNKGNAALVSSLSSVRFESASEQPQFSARKHEGDVLQLAHYQRILEALGFDAGDGRFAGIISTERTVVWHDLDAAVWKTPSLSARSKLRSAMERYDFEFRFRLDIIAVSLQHELDPAVDLLVVPVRCDECPTCPWYGYCMPILESPPGDVSLLPRVGWTQWKVRRDHGVTNRAELAALDITTAELVASGVDVKRLLDAAEDASPRELVASLEGVTLRTKDVRILTDSDIVTVSDLATLCRRTASYSDSGLTSLPTHIDLARAALGPSLAYRRRGMGSMDVPRAEIEVDVDMENVEEGCYMWGCLVTDRSSAELVSPGYRAFVTWEQMSPAVEMANSLAFWRWLMDVRAAALSEKLTFTAYCYNASAENTYLRRLALAAGIKDEIESFIASDEWIDMLKVWDSQLITGGPSGLKTTAPIAGFDWPVDDPDGGESMIRYDAAVGEGAIASDAREWLLRYNRGDVEATLCIREWIEHTEIPSIEDVSA